MNTYNFRIQSLITKRDEAEQKLQEALHDMEVREGTQEYQKALKLYESGVRLFTFNDYDDFLRLSPAEKGMRHIVENQPSYSIDNIFHNHPFHTRGSDRRKLRRKLKLASGDKLDEVIRHLVNITEERIGSFTDPYTPCP